IDAHNAFIRVYSCQSIPPNGFNFMYYCDKTVEAMMDKALNTFDDRQRDQILANVHSYLVTQAVDLWVVHDVAPRAMSAKVKGFVQVKNWYQDFTPVYVEN
ncbi:MAG: peptide/nickel transport system substrate-binding protein, partial [Betaproteobacteria bacterium]|nr:peptide/nickel transport system substrate-binding protein [Betaproteobacteria bacterium]